MSRYQFVWWGFSYWPWTWRRMGNGPYGAIYSWRLCLGPLEIRRWKKQ